MEVNQYRIHEEGLKHFFGPLEARIMDWIWCHTEGTVREVQETLSKDQEISFNAVMTVMNRLVDKGHLEKRRKGRHFSYRAVMDKEAFLSHQTQQLTKQLVQEYGELIVSHMVNALEEADPELLAKLSEKIGRRQEDGQKGGRGDEHNEPA